MPEPDARVSTPERLRLPDHAAQQLAAITGVIVVLLLAEFQGSDGHARRDRAG